MDFEIEVALSGFYPGWTEERNISEFWKRWKKGTETVFVVEDRELKDLGYISKIFKLRGKNKFVCIPVFNNFIFCEHYYIHMTMTEGNFPKWWTAILKVRDNISIAYK